MPVQMRPFELSDYPAARALWERTPGVGLSSADEPAAIEAFLARKPNLSLVATTDGQLVGTVLCGHDGRRGLIHHLVTAPEHRRSGIGRRLLLGALQGLRQAGIGKCHVLVFRDNADGVAFWRGIGAEERVELTLFSLPTRDRD
jgi:ribosomal protein S18 acetylase RimI-like enzyme